MKGRRQPKYQGIRNNSPTLFQAGAKVYFLPKPQAVRPIGRSSQLVSWNPVGDTAVSLSVALDKYTSKFLVSLQSTQFQIIYQEKNLKSKAAANRYYQQISSGNSTQPNSSFDLTNF